VILREKWAHEFIGTTHYAPQVTVTNNSEATVLVTGIELATKQRIYSITAEVGTGSHFSANGTGLAPTARIDCLVPTT
jgi:seryl-tRNA(Sec) selenium transferase